MKKLLFAVLLLLAIFSPTYAQTNVIGGGTGTSTVPRNWVLLGDTQFKLKALATSTLGLLTTDVAEGSNLYYTLTRWATALAGTTTDALAQGSTNKYFSDALARLALSATAPLSYDNTTGVFSCPTCGSGGGSGNVSTSTAETATYIPYWTSTAGTPALLSGGESTFTYDATENRLTIQRASTTDLTTTGTASTSALRASTSFTFKDVTGFLYATAGAVATKVIDLTTDITGVLPIANGGTNASALNSTQLLYNNGTRIAGTSTPTASYFVATSTEHRNVFPYASTTAITVASNAYFPGSGIWNSSGNVGIGTTSPDYLLTIGNTSGAANNKIAIDAAAARQSSISFRSAGVDKWFIGRGDTDVLSDGSFFIGNTSGGTVNDPGGASAKLTITSLGLVGIGTSTAATTEGLLHVADNTNGAVNSVVSNTNSGTGAFATFQLRNGGALGESLRLGVLGTGFTTTGGFIQDAGFIAAETNLSGGLSIMTRAAAPIAFYTNGSTNERMRIANDGNVGIGTTTPGVKLGVNGAINATDRVTALAYTATSTNNAINSVFPFASSTTYSIHPGSGQAGLIIRTTSGTPGNLIDVEDQFGTDLFVQTVSATQFNTLNVFNAGNTLNLLGGYLSTSNSVTTLQSPLTTRSGASIATPYNSTVPTVRFDKNVSDDANTLYTAGSIKADWGTATASGRTGEVELIVSDFDWDRTFIRATSNGTGFVTYIGRGIDGSSTAGAASSTSISVGADTNSGAGAGVGGAGADVDISNGGVNNRATGNGGNAGNVNLSKGGDGPDAFGNDGTVTIGNASGKANANFRVNGNATTTGTVYWTGLQLNTGAATASLCLDSNNQMKRNTDAETCIASSERYKENIAKLSDLTSDLLKLEPVSFRYKENNKVTHYGLIAEQVEKIDPTLISYDDKGEPNGIRWSHIITLLIQGHQDQEKRIAALEEQIHNLEAGTPTKDYKDYLPLLGLLGLLGFIKRKK